MHQYHSYLQTEWGSQAPTPTARLAGADRAGLVEGALLCSETQNSTALDEIIELLLKGGQARHVQRYCAISNQIKNWSKLHSSAFH
jgi:hypothetical protein